MNNFAHIKSKLKLSIIIINYNVKYFLEHCLLSVSLAADSLEHEIIVVDNASSDGSIDYLLSAFPDINFIDNPVNIGFAKANNQALQQAKGRYVLFLNPDTILAENCLNQCIDLMESNTEIGACGVRMIDGSGKFLPESKRAFPSLQTSFYKLSGLTRLFPKSKRFARYHLGHIPHSQNSEIDVLSGAYLMVRKKVLDVTGGFDERFFMYGEDIDLSLRIQQAGYKNFYLAETTIIHFKGESTRKSKLNHIRLFYKAMSLFVEKHYQDRNQKKFVFLIETSIWLRAGLAATKNLLIINRSSSNIAILNTLIIGTEEEAAEVITILNRQHQNRNSKWIKPGDNWNQALLLQMPDEMIFVHGILSYIEIIAHIQCVPKGILLSIFSTGGRSIIGSGSKNTNGFILV